MELQLLFWPTFFHTARVKTNNDGWDFYNCIELLLARRRPLDVFFAPVMASMKVMRQGKRRPWVGLSLVLNDDYIDAEKLVFCDNDDPCRIRKHKRCHRSNPMICSWQTKLSWSESICSFVECIFPLACITLFLLTFLWLQKSLSSKKKAAKKQYLDTLCKFLGDRLPSKVCQGSKRTFPQDSLKMFNNLG